MAKDVEERAKRRADQRAAAAAEKARGNAALKGGQYAEALGYYSRALDHDKSDKATYTNRALAHLKVGNYLSAEEDCTKALDICEFLDDCTGQNPMHPIVLKAYMRRAAARAGAGRFDGAEEDLRTALRTCSPADAKEVRHSLRGLAADRAEAVLEEELQSADSADGAALGRRARVQTLAEELQASPAQSDPRGRTVPVEAAADDDEDVEEEEEETETTGEASSSEERGPDVARDPARDDRACGKVAEISSEDPTAMAPKQATTTAALDAAGQRRALQELRTLLVAGEAERAVARQCGLLSWLAGALARPGVAAEATASLAACLLSPASCRALARSPGLARLTSAIARGAPPTGGGAASTSSDTEMREAVAAGGRFECLHLCAADSRSLPAVASACIQGRALGPLAAAAEEETPVNGPGLAAELVRAVSESALRALATLCASTAIRTHVANAATSDAASGGNSTGAAVLGVLTATVAAASSLTANPVRRHLGVEALGALSANVKLRAALRRLGAQRVGTQAALHALAPVSAGGDAGRVSVEELCCAANAAALLHNLAIDDKPADREHLLPQDLLKAFASVLADQRVRVAPALAPRVAALLAKAARQGEDLRLLIDAGTFQAAACLLRDNAPGQSAKDGTALEATGAAGDSGAMAEAEADSVSTSPLGPALKLVTILLQGDKALSAAACDLGLLPLFARCACGQGRGRPGPRALEPSHGSTPSHMVPKPLGGPWLLPHPRRAGSSKKRRRSSRATPPSPWPAAPRTSAASRCSQPSPSLSRP